MKFPVVHPESAANGPWWFICSFLAMGIALATLFGDETFQMAFVERDGSIAPIVFTSIAALFGIVLFIGGSVVAINKIRQTLWLKSLDRELTQRVVPW